MIQLLRLDTTTIVNPNKIVQVTVDNLNKLRQERRQLYQTPDQRERMDNKFWEVSVYIRSGDDGYNPQRWTRRFETEKQAQDFVQQKFGGVIVDNL